jgi:hypothetical protein
MVAITMSDGALKPRLATALPVIHPALVLNKASKAKLAHIVLMCQLCVGEMTIW